MNRATQKTLLLCAGLLALGMVWGCGGEAGLPPSDPGTGLAVPAPEPFEPAVVARQDAAVPRNVVEREPEEPDPERPVLEVRYMGVMGFALRRGEDLILTAPMYSNPGLPSVLLGDVVSNRERIDQVLRRHFVADAQAILVGHAHYDHLLDVPYVRGLTDDATVYGSATTKRLLAGFAPEQAAHCSDARDTEGMSLVPRDKVVAVNALDANRVDTRMCAGQEVCAGALPEQAGEWIYLDSGRIRIRALCASHPDQFLMVHFADGCLEEEACAPPRDANAWLEGDTLAFLIDFLDEEGAPEFRIYFQDAPTDAPVGHVHPELLAEKRVDLALLCVGDYHQVQDQPTEIIAALDPRYVIGGHWEDFFKVQAPPYEPIPFTPDPQTFVTRMIATLPPDGYAPAYVNGVEQQLRHWMPNPGTDFAFLGQD